MNDERTPRRAPHMERFVEVSHHEWQPLWQPQWRVRLKVGVQTFDIGNGYDEEDEANFMRDMLCIALDAIVNECAQPPAAAPPP